MKIIEMRGLLLNAYCVSWMNGYAIVLNTNTSVVTCNRLQLPRRINRVNDDENSKSQINQNIVTAVCRWLDYFPNETNPCNLLQRLLKNLPHKSVVSSI